MRKLLFTKEHVFSAAQADTLGSECAGLNGISRNVRVGTHSQPAERLGPPYKLQQLRFIRLCVESIELAFDYAAGGSIERNPIALLEYLAFCLHLASLLVNLYV